jgi:L-ascorbate metabolism protein UlaG (beta-lactamase superfamily)
VICAQSVAASGRVWRVLLTPVIGQAAGVVIHLGSHCVYHVGDSALFSDMALIGEMEKVDTMIVPIGGRYTMDVRAAVRATAFVKPRYVIPCHYNTFPAIKADAHDFARQVEAAGDISVSVLEPGDVIELS